MGIDASLTNFGLSVYGIDSGQHATMLFRPKFKGARRLQEIWEFVTLVTNAVEHSYVVEEYMLEDYAFSRGASRAHGIGEGGGAVKLALVQRYGVEDKIGYPTLVAANTLKKYVTGRGNAKKNEILLAVFRKWGVDFGSSDDMADAYSLARLGAALLSGETDHKYEHEVVDSLERNTEWVPKP